MGSNRGGGAVGNLIGSMVGLVLLVLLAVYTLNLKTDITKEEAAVADQGRIVDALHDRGQALATTAEAMAAKVPQEAETQASLAPMKAACGIEPRDRNEAHRCAQAALTAAAAIQAAVEARHPDVASGVEYKAFDAEATDLAQKLPVEEARYNDMASAYNTRIGKFPHALVAGVFGHEPALVIAT